MRVTDVDTRFEIPPIPLQLMKAESYILSIIFHRHLYPSAMSTPIQMSYFVDQPWHDSPENQAVNFIHENLHQFIM